MSTPAPAATSELATEAHRRRTFAIISHPDAGKTTLTEKLLLYGGAVQLAGSVTARRTHRKATSDWMAIEQERGISITSTVLAFPYDGRQVNLLDTPGHQDFCEDTYRTLTAADSAVMVLDAARGIEPQTLQAVRGLPAAQHPDLYVHQQARPARPRSARSAGRDRAQAGHAHGADELADRRRSRVSRGVYDLRSQTVHLFERTEHGAKRAPVQLSTLGDPKLGSLIGEARAATLRDEVELLSEAGSAFDLERRARLAN